MVGCFCRGQPLPLPLGEVAERSEDGEGRNVKKTCRCRHVKKICQWHIFSVDLSGYAAVASILVCTASSFSSDLSGYAAVASIRTYATLSWMPSQSPAVTALPKGEPREGQSPSPTESLPHPSLASAGRVWYTIPHRWATSQPMGKSPTDGKHPQSTNKGERHGQK